MVAATPAPLQLEGGPPEAPPEGPAGLPAGGTFLRILASLELKIYIVFGPSFNAIWW